MQWVHCQAGPTVGQWRREGQGALLLTPVVGPVTRAGSSVGERLYGIQEVEGSSPSPSTKVGHSVA